MPNTYTKCYKIKLFKLSPPPFVRFLKMTAITDIQYEVGPYSAVCVQYVRFVWNLG